MLNKLEAKSDMCLNGSKSDKWLRAMELEIDSMYENQVWTMVV